MLPSHAYMEDAQIKATGKKYDYVKLIAILAAFICLILILLNLPMSVSDRDSVLGQLLATVIFSAAGIWIADQKWKALKKAEVFMFLSGATFILWSMSATAYSSECKVDIMLFKSGSGDLITPQVFAMFDNNKWLNGELVGYNKLSELQNTSSLRKKNETYDQDLIAVSFFSWLHDYHLDWSGCEAQPIFIGLSDDGSQLLLCDNTKKKNTTELKKYFPDFAQSGEIDLPASAKFETFNEKFSKKYELHNLYAEISLKVLNKIYYKELPPHRAESKLLTIEENIARYYRDRPQPLSANGFQAVLSYKQQKLTRWSATSSEYQKSFNVICAEFEKAFSWYELKKSLESAFQANHKD